MPVKVVQRGHKYRIVEAETGRVAKRSTGKPVDGGGHVWRDKAERQARAINASLEKKEKG